MITVWGRKTSSNVQAVMWCIGELGLAYERIDAGFTYGVVDTEHYLAMNPNGTVPTIQDNDQAALFESGAIMRYLAAAYGDNNFWPQAPANRARTDQWAEWAKLNIAMQFTTPIFWQVVRLPERQRDPAAISKAIDQFEKNLRLANSQLETRPYLAGEHFTLADIQLGHVLFRYFDLPIERINLPALSEYYGRLARRQPFTEHVIVSYEELRGSL